MSNRRSFFRSALGLGAGLISKSAGAGSVSPPVAVQSPDLQDLPFTVDNGVKVFHLIAEPVRQQIAPNKIVDAWGFNGSAPGPTIHVTNGDRVRLIVDNHLPEPTSMHWHGFEIPSSMDGGPGISQQPIKPGGRFVYEFTLRQEGTFFYHSHMAMQEMMGMLGAFIMHPKNAYQPRVDKDFVILLQEYAVLPNNSVPNTMNMEFNWLLINGKAGPAATPLIVRLGDRVRIRMINLGMDHHPIHVHGHTFYVTGTEAGRIPEAGWWPGNTVLVGVAQARDVEFVANNPGDWMLHCHLPHHMMNQMSSMAGPMSRSGKGMPAGGDMNIGMGMLNGTPGAPSGEEYGPVFGRGLGVGSANDRAATNGPLSPQQAMPGMQQAKPGIQHDMPDMQHGAMGVAGNVAGNANSVPGFPQDAFMEGPMMAMDEAVRKPQNFGLPKGWSGYMQGMMTLVRVLPPDQYDRVMKLVAEGGMNMPGMQHQM
ncbi:MAG: copper oxidase [Acidobacteriaceae bacterium]|nr:copper oxidase [Acidobacteriaceae bacterium]